MVKPLDPNVVDQVYAELREGFALLKNGEPARAEPHLARAWALIPEPKYDWDISQTTVIHLAKFYRDAGKFPAALQWAQDIFQCNPLPKDGEPHFILGSVHFEAGDRAAARQHFQKAFDLAGKRAFNGEDPKYFKFLKEKPA